MSKILIKHATQGNLKNVSIALPRENLIVFTGLSGSGKSTLAVDVLFNECQRQYLEAMNMQGIQKPRVEIIENVSPALLICQSAHSNNPRSTLGTLTNIYTDLRMIYEKIGITSCPLCHQQIAQANCKEIVERHDGEFTVFMICEHCGEKIPKVTRSHFSTNTREGACPTCLGLGKKLTVCKETLIHEELSLEEGAIDFWEAAYRDYQIKQLYYSYEMYDIAIPRKVAVKNYTPIQRAMLLEGTQSDVIMQEYPLMNPKTLKDGKFEGVYPLIWRRLSIKGEMSQSLEKYFIQDICPTCHGERLNPLSAQVSVMERRLPELVLLSLKELYDWLLQLEKELDERSWEVSVYLFDLKTKINRIMKVGLGYLTLERQTMTLSGGELQRIQLAAMLDSTLTGILYIMDEPTVGLHAQDTQGIIELMKDLRDKGNTVLIIEHDEDVMRAADFLVDIGPRSGKFGGEVVAFGTYQEIKENARSLTGAYLGQTHQMTSKNRRVDTKRIVIKNATTNNLKHLDVSFPTQCLCCVSGVSGSGKSTLVFDVLSSAFENHSSYENLVEGLDSLSEIIQVQQAPLTRMKRSNVATYTQVYEEIRKIFGHLEESKKNMFTAKHFSFNTAGGRCENCEGLGVIQSNMLFFKDIEVTCPVCLGKQFHEEILAVKYQNKSIKEVLECSIEEAHNLFLSSKKISKTLKLLMDVGLGYLELGQTLTTLSAGEGQRLKLARDLIQAKSQDCLYLIDEPTMGLHPFDVENFLMLLQRLVDEGNTVIVVEHNLQVMAASDWIVDLGPNGGVTGGELMFAGTPQDLLEDENSKTAQVLRRFLQEKK